MAATCQERGIAHIKDIFSGTEKDESDVQGYFFGLDTSSTNKRSNSSNNNSNITKGGNSKPGAFIMRSGKDVDVMEIPVPPPARRKGSERGIDDQVSRQMKDTYLSPRAVQKNWRPDIMNGEVGVPTSPKKFQAPLPPPIAFPPPPPPYKGTSFSAPFNAPPPPPSPTTLPPPPPPTNGKLPQSPPISPYLHPPAPLSPTYTRTITADVHHQYGHKNRNSDENFNTKIFEDKYLSTSPINNELEVDKGSLFSGEIDDDGDILNNLDTSVFSNDSIPESKIGPGASNDSGIHILEDRNNKRNSSSSSSQPMSPIFNKNNDKNNKSNIKHRSRFISPNRNNKRSSTDTETDSSLLTAGSEHGAASSGYFSELSMSDSERLPSPPPAFKSPPKTINESSSSFEEDECTLDFGDDDFYENKHKKVYHEYQGEDFAQYLQDDDYTTSTTSLARKVQKHKQRQQYQQQQHTRKREAVSPNRKYAAQGAKKPGLKDRISQAFTLTRSDRKSYEGTTPTAPKNKIHTFSFINSKMGMYASEEELHEYMTRDMETKSDFGGVKKSPAQVPSWHKDTLSASTLRRAKVMLDKRTMSNSVPNLTEKDKYNSLPNSTQNSSNGVHHHGASFSDFGADITHKKKVNRFKFWKIFGANKKDKKNRQVTSPDIKIEPQVYDVRL